jgi:hypothetical protein
MCLTSGRLLAPVHQARKTKEAAILTSCLARRALAADEQARVGATTCERSAVGRLRALALRVAVAASAS